MVLATLEMRQRPVKMKFHILFKHNLFQSTLKCFAICIVLCKKTKSKKKKTVNIMKRLKTLVWGCYYFVAKEMNEFLKIC